MKTQIFNITDLKEISEFKNLFTTQPVDDLIYSMKQEGQLVPIHITSDGHIIDGYRRVQALNSLGLSTILVTIREKKPTIYDRILLNQYRIKTTEDQIMELKFLFKKFPKSQGAKSTNGEVYRRDELISGGLNCRFKGDKVISKLENIISYDLPGDILLKGILEKGWKVDTCNDFISTNHKKDLRGNYGFTKRLVDGQISVSEANKFITEMEGLSKGANNITFKIPERGSIYNMNCIDLAKLDEHHSSVDLIFTSPPYYKLRAYQSNEPYQLGHERTAKEYCENLANIIQGLVPVLKKSANVMINIGETYFEGKGYGIPFLLQQAIQNNTSLIYHDTLIWSKPNPKPQNESIKRPINNVEYILWFVVNSKEAKYNLLKYPDENRSPKLTKGARDIDQFGNVYRGNLTISKPYRKIFSHLQQQEIENIIKCTVGQNHEIFKISSSGHPAIMSTMLPVVPILMTTNETDCVFDPFAGSNVVGRVAQLLNRRSLSTELSHMYYSIGCEMLREGVAEYSPKDLSFINQNVYEKSIITCAA
jgi:DNA modification methylase